jgi:hypothetical protein
MILAENIWNFLSVPLVFLLGLISCIFLGVKLKISSVKIFILYFYHTLVCFIYYWYVVEFGGDAVAYYKSAQAGFLNFNFGTDFINLIVYFLYNFFKLSLISVFLIFNIFGAIGLLLFFHCLQMALKNNRSYFSGIIWVIILLPSISFWSSGIGKDSLSFLAVTLAMWAALELKKRLLAMVAAITIMYLVRPHIAAMMIMALTFSIIIENNISATKKLIIGFLILGIFPVFIPFALRYAGLDAGFNSANFIEYIKIRQNYNLEGGGGINISTMILPEQLFAYMFRPTLFEGNSIFFMAAGFDNLILLVLFLFGVYSMFFNARSHLGESRVFMWSYALMAWLALAMTTANLGIALRQKWMFAPCLIFLFISAIANKKRLDLPN